MTVAGGLGTALLPTPAWRGQALAAVGIGLAGLLFVLSAGFAGIVVLVCFLACAYALAGRGYRRVWDEPAGRWEQAGAAASGILLLALLYTSWRADFFAGAFSGGSFGSAAVSRLLLAQDGLAGDALALLAGAAFVTTALFWRGRQR